ncbi:MAG: entericidin A/B family lipoprotein [Burkholderiales bacterium]|nr:entericidin A/B family lipoprotein [Burkholderiales bacterium]MCH2242427.1 entericidin A/B family lipoprotein [Aquabacterium sp.]
MSKTTWSLLGALLCSLTLSACNTVEGAGKDVERAGEKVQGAAQDAKR